MKYKRVKLDKFIEKEKRQKNNLMFETENRMKDTKRPGDGEVRFLITTV